MATDPQLPGILATAAGRVERVAEQLTAISLAAQTTAMRAMIGWSGPRSEVWGPGCLRLSRDLIAEARMAQTLAASLRTAETNARTRLHYEALAAAEARRKAEAAARARTTK